MRYSENLNLKIPEMTDHANVEDISENFEVLDEALAGNTNHAIVLSSSDGVTYVAEVPGVKALFAGLQITAVPETGSAAAAVRLDVNGLGSVPILMRGSANTGSTLVPTSKNWLSAGAPVQLTYNGSAFVAEVMKTSAQDLDGVLPVEKGGHGGKTAAEARTNLGITPANIGAQKTVTGAASTVVSSNVTASRVLVSNTSGKIAASGVTATELTALSGIEGNVQEQLDEKAEEKHTHNADDIESGTTPVIRGGTGRESITANSFLVGAGTEALLEKTPAEVLKLISGASVEAGTFVGVVDEDAETPELSKTLTFSRCPQLIVVYGRGAVTDVCIGIRGCNIMLSLRSTSDNSVYSSGIMVDWGENTATFSISSASTARFTFMKIGANCAYTVITN